MDEYDFKQNKYLTYYNHIIKTAGGEHRVRETDTHYENHHIIPKSVGGSNSRLNLVLLTGREHFIVHLLLVRCVQDADVYRMVNAIRRFKKKVKTAREFALLRATISTFSKGALNPSYGKVWIHNIHTLEISYILLSEFNLLPSDQYKQGLPYQRGGHRGTTWVNNGIVETVVKKSEVETYLTQSWAVGRLNPVGIEHMRHMASHRHTVEKDKKHSRSLSGRVAVTHINTRKVKRIRLEQIPEYTELGYSRDIPIATSLCRKCRINNVVYETNEAAAVALGIPRNAIGYRLSSQADKWKEWIRL